MLATLWLLLSAFCTVNASAQSTTPDQGTPAPTQDPSTTAPLLSIAGEMDAARLVDLCAEHLGLLIDYDQAVVRGQVVLRTPGPLTKFELWQLTNQTLAGRGFTSVRREGLNRFSVVRLQDAAGVAIIESLRLSDVNVEPRTNDDSGENDASAKPEAGFRVVLIEPRHRSARELAESVRAVFHRAAGNVGGSGGSGGTGPAGSLVQETQGGMLLVGDLSERIKQIVRFLAKVDGPASPIVVEEYQPRFLAPQDLATLTAQVIAKRDVLLAPGSPTPAPGSSAPGSTIARDAPDSTQPGGRDQTAPSANEDLDAFGALRGEVLASSNGTSVLIIAPRDRIANWRDLISQLDKREPVTTITYTPRYFAATDVARLVEQTARLAPGTVSPGTSATPKSSAHSTSTAASPGAASTPMTGIADDRLRVVIDELTGTLLVTATSSQHARIRDLIARLDEAPSGIARPVRAFPLRNRPVSEVLGTLSNLVAAGPSDAAPGSPGPGPAPGPAPAPGSGPGSQSGSNTARSSMMSNERDARDQRARGLDTDASGSGPDIRTFGPQSQRADPLGLNTGTPRLAGDQSQNRADATAQGRWREAGRDLVLTADQQTNTLIAVGEPRMLTQIEALLKLLDVRQPQVMLRVFLVSLNDSQSLQLGVEIENLISAGSTRTRLASLFGLSTSGPDGRVAGDALGFTGVVINPGELSIVIRALQTLNEGQSLSVPKVLVNNNEQAQFSSVLQQPFTNTNLSNSTTITSFGGFQDAGTIISVRPQIAEGDHLVLEYSLALSSFVGAPAAAGLPPPRQQNRVDSIATVPDGHTVVVGGLEVTTEGESESRVPLLGAIPILGEAFKSRTKNASRTRFFVFIQPAVLRHEGFEDLKFLSDRDLGENKNAGVGIDAGWPEVQPRMIK